MSFMNLINSSAKDLDMKMMSIKSIVYEPSFFNEILSFNNWIDFQVEIKAGK
jgi:hypothetical protein